MEENQTKSNLPLKIWLPIVVIFAFAAGYFIWLNANQPFPPDGKLLIRHQEQQIDTSTWQTYRNEELGFEVKYLKDWYLNFEEPNVEFASVPTSEYAHGVGMPAFGNAWLVISKRDSKGTDGESIEEIYKNIKVVDMIKFVANQNLIYEIRLSFYQGDSNEKNYRVLFNQILSTFKFIK